MKSSKGLFTNYYKQRKLLFVIQREDGGDMLAVRRQEAKNPTLGIFHRKRLKSKWKLTAILAGQICYLANTTTDME